MDNSLQTYLTILKREKSMTSSLKQVKIFSDLKLTIVSAMKKSCGQLFLIGFSDWKERKSITSLLRLVKFSLIKLMLLFAMKNSCGQLFVI